MRIALRLLISIAFFQSACGGAKVSLDPTQGEESPVRKAAGSDDSAESYFQSNLFPIMKGSDAKGCAISGCHLINASNAGRATDFQVNPSDASATYNWARVRRVSVEVGTYAAASAELIKARSAANHQAFSSWTAAEKQLVEIWSGLQNE